MQKTTTNQNTENQIEIRLKEVKTQPQPTSIFCTGREFDLTMFFKAWSNMVSTSDPCFSFLLPGIKSTYS